jgi:predicted metal-dependent hydrolase
MPQLELVVRDERSLELEGERVPYVLLRRKGRRGVGLKIDQSGLAVSAPLTTPVASIEDMIRDNTRWVTKKLREWAARRIPEQAWHEGACVPWMGGELVLLVDEGARAACELRGGALRVTVRERAGEAIRRAVTDWYRKQALPHFAYRAFVFARAVDLKPPRVMVSGAATRWGSCNSRREVRLSWRLMKAAPALIDYVVCHELAHLRHMDHSSAFWAEVERMCPDYRVHRKELDRIDHLYRAF